MPAAHASASEVDGGEDIKVHGSIGDHRSPWRHGRLEARPLFRAVTAQQFLDAGAIDRAREEETLQQVAAHLTEQLGLLDRLDALGYRGEVERVTESDEVGIDRFEQPERLPPDLVSRRIYLFPGGCVVYAFHFRTDTSAALTVEVDEALSFVPRAELVDEVRDRSGLRLCGAGVTCEGP